MNHKADRGTRKTRVKLGPHRRVFQPINYTGRRWLIVLLTLVSSCTQLREPGVSPPVSSGTLAVVAQTSAVTIPAGRSITLSAEATGGKPPFLYRWDLNSGPTSVDLGLQDTTSAILNTPGLLTEGRYVFRVSVTDANARTGSAFVSIDVAAAIMLTTNSTMLTIFEGEPATIDVAVQSDSPPVQFVWEQIDGPVTLDLSDQTSSTLTTPPLPQPGTFTFRLTATDSLGAEATTTITVVAEKAFTAEAPPLAVIGQPTALSASFDAAADGGTILWEVLQGTATIDNPASLMPNLTTNVAETVVVRVTATSPGDQAQPSMATREFELASIPNLSPRVAIETTRGNLVMELNGELAPRHTGNFLLYVDDGFYDGLLIHRIACRGDQQAASCDPFVIQGGGFERIADMLTLREPTRDPIMSEAKPELSNSVIHSVALALTAGDPNSGATQFFVNMADNGFLDAQGFTAFGLIVDGFDVLDQLLTLPREQNPFAPPGEVSLPTDDVMIERVRRLTP